MARPTNTEERRRQITKALAQVMAEKGYDGASIADVAKAAGLTTGLVHYHFKNKLEILLAVFDELVQEHAIDLGRFLEGAEEDPEEQLARFIDFHLAVGDRANPRTLACWIIFSGEAQRHPPVRERYERAMLSIVQRVVDILEQGRLSMRFRCADPRASAAAIVAAIQGYFVLAATARRVIPRATAASSVRQMAAGLLGLQRLESRA